MAKLELEPGELILHHTTSAFSRRDRDTCAATSLAKSFRIGRVRVEVGRCNVRATR
jgi:hypothetical protein